MPLLGNIENKKYENHKKGKIEQRDNLRRKFIMEFIYICRIKIRNGKKSCWWNEKKNLLKKEN